MERKETQTNRQTKKEREWERAKRKEERKKTRVRRKSKPKENKAEPNPKLYVRRLPRPSLQSYALFYDTSFAIQSKALLVAS